MISKSIFPSILKLLFTFGSYDFILDLKLGNLQNAWENWIAQQKDLY